MVGISFHYIRTFNSCIYLPVWYPKLAFRYIRLLYVQLSGFKLRESDLRSCKLFFFAAKLSSSSAPQIVSDTIGPMERSGHWKQAAILWSISGDHARSFLSAAPANSKRSSCEYNAPGLRHAATTVIVLVVRPAVSGQIMEAAVWPLSLSLSILAGPKRSTFERPAPLTMHWGYHHHHPAAEEIFTSPSSCTENKELRQQLEAQVEPFRYRVLVRLSWKWR